MVKKMAKSKFSIARCAASLAAVGDALYAIGGKWKLRIIIALSERKKRFNDLHRTVTGISAKVLSNELKELEMHGFIKRIVYIKKPVVVEYELTDYSNTLEHVIQSLSEWGIMHKKKVRKGIRKETSAVVKSN